MKYVIILGDGMSDQPDADGQTPLSLAHKPNIDRLAAMSEIGLVETVPEGFSPGSDIANLSVMGFDPKLYYTGRSPLEAVSMNIPLLDGHATYRVNLVTLSDEPYFEQKRMIDYSAGEIDSVQAAKLIELLKPLVPEHCRLYAGVSYRHCMVSAVGGYQNDLTPPHNITDKYIADYLPKGKNADSILQFMKRANALLSAHPDNHTKANAAWVWGEGTKPKLPDFQKKFGIQGAVISAVDLLKGIGISAGMTCIDVSGATGNLHTNWNGKANAAIEALKTHDFLFLHIEAPDECGHQGDRVGKIRAIELLDEKIIAPIVSALEKSAEAFNLLVMPDHATPLCLKTHTRDAVPYLLYRSSSPQKSGVPTYTEQSAKNAGIFVNEGCRMIQKLLN